MPTQINFDHAPIIGEQPSGFSDALGVSPLTAALLLGRNLLTVEAARAFLESHTPLPAAFANLPHLPQAVTLLNQLSGKAKIFIWADRDVDGVCAGIILFECLLGLGYDPYLYVGDSHAVPKSDFAALLMDDFRSDCFILCDVAWSGFYAYDYAKIINLPIIHADHHPLPPNVTDTEKAIFINPTLLDSEHPLAHLTGAGVAYALAMTLDPHPTAKTLLRRLELVTLGLLADVALLKGAVRGLLQQGLSALRQTDTPGLLALYQRTELDPAHLTYDDLGFRIIPLLNAFARLDSASKIAQLLTTHDLAETVNLAAQAEGFNNQRKLLTRQMLGAIYSQIEADSTLLNPPALVLSNTQWEAGLLGAVAGQLAAEYQRPVALLIPQADSLVRGSARGYGNYDVAAALTQLGDLLTTSGGHPHAAGFSLSAENLPLFPRQFNNALKAQSPDHTPPSLPIEAQWPLQQINIDLTHDLEKLAPFGNGNPRPILADRDVTVLRSAKLGRDQQHRRLTLRDSSGMDHNVFWWNSAHLPMPAGLIDLAYQVAPVYRDNLWQSQLTLLGWQPVAGAQTDLATKPQWIDCRQALDLTALKTQEPELSIWAEGVKQSDSVGLPLSALEPAPALLIYTAPANPALLEKALEKVQPQRIYLHAALPPFETPQKLAEAIAALLRAAIQQWEGQVTLTQIAERTAHRPDTIRLGLEALADYIEISWETSQRLHVHHANTPSRIQHPQFEQMVNETLAYRRYLGKVAIESLS